MKRRIMLVLAAVAVAWLFLPISASRGDYLGKSAIQWHQELVQAKDAQAKRSAAFALGKLKGEALAAAPELMRCAESDAEEVGVRETAAFSLGQIAPKGQAEVVQLLCRLATAKVNDSDDRLRRSAVIALGHCANEDAAVRAALQQAMSDKSPAVRQNASWALGEVCQKTGAVPVQALRQALRDGDKLVKRDAALALAKIISPHPGGDDEKRLAKVREQSRQALPELLTCVNHDYLELKKAACGTLINVVNSSDANAIQVLASACGNADIEVRLNAALALATIGGEGAKPAVAVLREALRDNEHPERRQEAALAFKKLGPAGVSALPELLKALTDDPNDHKLHYYAAVALGGLGPAGQPAVPSLAKRVADPKEISEVRIQAAMSLQAIGNCEQAVNAIPQLVAVLSDPSQPAKVRERVLWALRVHEGNLGKYDEVFAALTNVLGDANLRDAASGGKMLRFDAAFLLAIFNKQRPAPDEVFPVLLDFLKDPTIRIFTGLKTSGGAIKEDRSTSKTNVAEQGGEDGRIMALQALENIGPERCKKQQAIIQQLREIRDGNGQIEAKMREETRKLLEKWKVK